MGLVVPESPLIGGIMLMPVYVPDVAVEVVKAPLGRIAGPFLRGMPPTLQAILPEMDGVIPNPLQGIGKIPVILNRLVELHVAHISVPLMHPRDQRGSGGRADRSRTVMPVQDRSLRGHRVQLGSLNLSSFPLLLEENSYISVSKVICQNENNVRLPCGDNWGGHRQKSQDS